MEGFCHPDFEAVKKALELSIPSEGAGGAAVTVYHRGEKVVDLAAGTRDESGAPFQLETLAMAMSTSKGVCATLLHILVDRGLINYESPVADYWPEFAQNGKSRITVHQVASHQSGLYPVAPLIEHKEQVFDWEAMIKAIEEAAPVHEPGTNFGYHAWTLGWMLGEIMQRATGKSLQDLLEEYIAGPLELDGLYIGMPESELPRRADLILPGGAIPVSPKPVRRVATHILSSLAKLTGINTNVRESIAALVPSGLSELDLNDERFATSAIPSVNGTFNARSLARLYACLAHGGSLDGVRLLAPEILARATADQNGTVGRVVPFPLRVKMGYHRPISLGLRWEMLGRKFEVGVANPNAFGHFGFGGSGAWADPERDLAVGLVTNCFFGKLPLDLRTVAVCTAAGYAVDARN